MQREIKIDKIVRSRRRTIALIITKDAALEVRAPRLMPLRFIWNFIERKQNWILRKQEFMRNNLLAYAPKMFLDGEEFWYLGTMYPLKIINSSKIILSENLQFPSALLNDANKHLTAWYKKEARAIITERIVYYADLVKLKYKTIKITSAKTRWGSCSARGGLNFTWRLVMAPLAVVDYVVVHELVHLVERNHSQRFWQKVANIMPDYQARRRWLKQNGNKMGF